MGKAASLWGAALVGAAVLALSGCSAAESRDTTIIRVAFNQSESHPEYIAMTEFGKKFSEATDGKYEVQIYPNAIMGDQGPVTELVRTGALFRRAITETLPLSQLRIFTIIRHSFCRQQKREYLIHYLKQQRNLILRWYLCIHLEQGLFTQISRF